MVDKIIYGIDLSLNHWAICKVDYETGDCIDYLFMTNTKTELAKDPEHGRLLPAKDTKNFETAECYTERRKSFIFKCIKDYIWSKSLYPSLPNNGEAGILYCHDSDKVYISLEGYAYSALSQSLTQIAEVTGCIKRFLYESGYSIRIHDPLTVKLYATGKGNCLKKDIVIRAKESGLSFPDALIKVTKKKKKVKTTAIVLEEYDGVGTDIADAYFLARILRLELLLRDGKIDLKDLPESERNIFLRTTKSYPENILSRSFIRQLDEQL